MPFKTLEFSKSTTSLQTLPQDQQVSDVRVPKIRRTSINSHDISSRQPFEYEDIIFGKKPVIQPLKLTDILARESDVTVSNQIAPLTEYKGYALYLIVTVFHILWLIWTFAPKSLLNTLGVYYYPSRWWSIASSSIVLMAMLYTYIALLFWNVEYETLKLDDLRSIVDDDAVIERNIDRYGWDSTNGVFDLRITDVNKVLYGD